MFVGDKDSVLQVPSRSDQTMGCLYVWSLRDEDQIGELLFLQTLGRYATVCWE